MSCLVTLIVRLGVTFLLLFCLFCNHVVTTVITRYARSHTVSLIWTVGVKKEVGKGEKLRRILPFSSSGNLKLPDMDFIQNLKSSVCGKGNALVPWYLLGIGARNPVGTKIYGCSGPYIKWRNICIKPMHVLHIL